MKKLAIITTHPIQYNAPWFKLLAESDVLDLKVFYTWSQTKISVKDRVFGEEVKWDLPLLDGYNSEFVENVSKSPGSHHFFGIKCPELLPKIKTFKPDVILVFGWNFETHFKVMRYFKGKIPLWFRGDSTLLDEQPGLKTFLRRIVLKTVYKYIDFALFVGAANKAYYVKHGLNEDQLLYAPHAIDNNRFTDNDTHQYEIQASKKRIDLGYKPNDIVIVFAGKFENKKQPNFLINAVISANKNRKQQIKLLLVGNGPLKNQLKRKSLPFDFIKFLPFQNQTQMPIVYHVGDVFCLPSKGPGETWGLAVNEAMASSKMVLVSDKSGCSADIVRQHYNGYVFNANNEQELTHILTDLDLKKTKAMGLNSSALISNFRFNKIIDIISQNI
mgnify:FL=1